MKLSAIILLGAVAALAAAGEPLTHETTRWLFASADLGDATGDGRADVALVDRASGTLSIGFQRVDGGFDWTPPQATGIAAPSGLALAPFNGVPTYQIAVTSPTANRIGLFTPVDAVTAAGIRHAWPSWPSPRSLAGLEIDGSGASDLVVVGHAGGASHYTEFLHQLDTSPASLWGDDGPTATARIWTFQRKSGEAPVLAGIQSGAFLTAEATAAGPQSPLPLPAYTADPETRMTYGFFDGSALAQVILYVPGQALAHSAKVTEPTLGNFGWGAVAALNLPMPVALIVTIPHATGARLAVLYTDSTAATFDFDGAVLTPRSALPGNGHELLLAVADDALLSLRAGAWQRWNSLSTDAVLSPVKQGAMPVEPMASATSNIIFVSHEPFADPDAEPVFHGQVRDWTLAASGGGSSWSVTSLVYGFDGLGSPALVSYQPVPGAAHALPNQYRPDVSLRSLEPSVGPPVLDVVISPAGGTYPPPVPEAPFAVTFAATAAGAQIHFRTAATGAWLTYDDNAPPTLAADATVEAFATLGGVHSPTRGASYAFGAPTPLVAGPFLDEDGDGLPDQWEKAFDATDPLADADGDGVNNRNEFLNGTDPRDPSSYVIGPPVLYAFVTGSGANRVLRLEWPVGDTTSRLETGTDLAGWSTIATGITITATHYRYDVSLHEPAPPRRFFRLARP